MHRFLYNTVNKGFPTFFRLEKILLPTLFQFMFIQAVLSQSFGSGNIVVLRVGTGLDPLSNTGAPAFLDEYSPTGTYVSQTIIPTTASGLNKICILGGTGASEGMINRSIDGRYLLLTGYDRALGQVGSLSSTTASTVNRTVARIDADKNINLTTALTDFASGGSPRSVASLDGMNFWAVGGTGGVRYFGLGATTSTQLNTSPTNMRTIAIFDNNLYSSASSGTFRVGQIGSGLPTTAGQSFVNLPGLPETGSPYQFFLTDLNGAVPGPDVLYVADDGIGLLKYSLVGGTWVANGSIGTGSDTYRGLTGIRNPDNTVTLYAVRNGGTGASGGGNLVRINDNTGYNATIVGAPTLLATATTNQAFRGVALAPEGGVVPLNLLTFSASRTGTAVSLRWTTSQEIDIQRFVVERSSDGRQFKPIMEVKAKGSLLYNEYAATDPTAAAGTLFYRLRILEKDGVQQFSKIVRMDAPVGYSFKVWPNPVPAIGASLQVQHPKAGRDATLSLHAMDGRLIHAMRVAENSTLTAWPIPYLTAGMYWVKYASEGKSESHKLMVE